ncbi:PRD domain-containing protein [Clostridium polynesiense]|uniref:PRD domain-containing protein n=1 Tax=Clostridium polynesiense TaxID=1325933 RepID=UPI00058FBDD4|nr:PRD domain-containing protein [Clostridium polynesiense]
MDLTLRLNILKDAGQINEEIYEKILAMIKCLEKKFGIELTEENGAMFVTHMSIALKRIAEGNPVEHMDDFILEQLKSEKEFNKSQEVLDLLEKELELNIPDSEKSFVLMHLCTLLSK